MPTFLRILTYMIVTVIMTGAAFVTANSSARKLFDTLLAKLVQDAPHKAPSDNIKYASSHNFLIRPRSTPVEAGKPTNSAERISRSARNNLETSAQYELPTRTTTVEPKGRMHLSKTLELTAFDSQSPTIIPCQKVSIFKTRLLLNNRLSEKNNHQLVVGHFTKSVQAYPILTRGPPA